MSAMTPTSTANQRGAVWGGAAALIFGPLAALKIADPAAWDYGDLPFAVILLAILGGTYEAAARSRAANAYRTGAIIALATGLLQAWANLAVGIVGNEGNPANLLFFAPIAVAALGAVLARLNPYGMVPAMVAAAVAQVGVAILALALGHGFTGPITVLFAGLWLIAAWCFRRAAVA